MDYNSFLKDMEQLSCSRLEAFILEPAEAAAREATHSEWVTLYIWKGLELHLHGVMVAHFQSLENKHIQLFRNNTLFIIRLLKTVPLKLGS